MKLCGNVVEIECKPQEEKEFKIYLVNNFPQEDKETESLVVENLGLLRGEEFIQLWDEHNVSEGGNKIRLKPKKKYKINGKFTGASIGQLKVPVLATFYHEGQSQVVDDKHKTSRMVLEILFKVQDDEVKSLQPAAPYVPPERSAQHWRGRETVRGQPLSGPGSGKQTAGNCLEIKLPLGRHEISGCRRRVIEGRLEECGSSAAEEKELRRCQELTTKELSMENYGEKWELLLHCERHKEEKDIRQFDMSGEQLHIDKLATRGTLALDVPGLLEGKPSLIKGDKLFITSDKAKEYEGIVHSVGKTRVLLGFSPEIIPRVKDFTFWFIRFKVSPYTYDTMQRAVKLCQQSNLGKFLFPQSSDLPIGTQNDVVLRYYDEQVSDNPEQRQAVTAIVTGRSGRVPYLVGFSVVLCWFNQL